MRPVRVHVMQGPENRITNASLIGHTIHSATFVASTTMNALATMLGMLDRYYAELDGFDLTIKMPGALAGAKGLLALAVLAQTFLKLSWALQQHNDCLADWAAPIRPTPDARGEISGHMAPDLTPAINNCNAGVHGYISALAAMGWLLGPVAFC